MRVFLVYDFFKFNVWLFFRSNMSRRHDSENEDDPEPFESSGDEWNAEVSLFIHSFSLEINALTYSS